MFKVKKNCSPEVSLENSLKEMKLIREEKLTKTTWEEFKKEEKSNKQEE